MIGAARRTTPSVSNPATKCGATTLTNVIGPEWSRTELLAHLSSDNGAVRSGSLCLQSCNRLGTARPLSPA